MGGSDKIRKRSGGLYTIIFVVNSSVRTTKKVLLAIGIVFVYTLYTFVLRNQHSGPVIAPASLNSSSSPSSTASNSGSSGSNGGTGMGSSVATQYKDGTYTGSVANAFYGNVQIQVSISGGKISNIQFLQYPNDNPNSQYISSQATPYLKQEALQVQSANVNAITGATFTSQAFMQSMSSALNQAKA